MEDPDRTLLYPKTINQKKVSSQSTMRPTLLNDKDERRSGRCDTPIGCMMGSGTCCFATKIKGKVAKSPIPFFCTVSAFLHFSPLFFVFIIPFLSLSPANTFQTFSPRDGDGHTRPRRDRGPSAALPVADRRRPQCRSGRV